MKTIDDVKEFINKIGAISNPEIGDDHIGFLMRHYDYLAHRVAAAESPEGGFYCIRDANGNIVWEGTTQKKVTDPK